MAVIYPPKTEVVDHIHHEAFRVTEQNQQTPLPLYDPKTMLVTTGKETKADLFADAKSPFAKPQSSGWLTASVILAAAVGVTLYGRHRRTLWVRSKRARPSFDATLATMKTSSGG
jgi:hypothetical protein